MPKRAPNRLITAWLVVGLTRGLQAQTGTVAGTVVADGSQRPLAGAQIVVEGPAGRVVVTDGSGAFRVAGITDATVVLSVRLIGYRPIVDTVRVGSANLRYALVERAVELSSVVVTGTPGSAEKRQLGTSVATVDVVDVLARTSVPTVEGLLLGRAPGVSIIGTSGQVGAG